MALHFNAGTCSFHDDALGKPPAGAVPVSAERHAELLAGQARGEKICAGADGCPQLRRPAVLPLAVRRSRAIAAIKADAARRIELVAPIWRQLNDLRAASVSIEPLPMAAVDRFLEIDRLRDVSNKLEAEVCAMTANQLAGFRAGADHHWIAQEITS